MLGSLLGFGASLASDVLGIGGRSQQQQSQTNRDSFSQASGNTFVDPSQRPYLDFLRNTGQGLVGQQMQGTQGLFGTADQLYGRGQGFLDQLGSSGQNLSGFGSTALRDAQIGQLGSDLGNFLQTNVLPAIGRDAVGVGGFGGGRQQVAEGVAAGDIARAFTSGATDIYNNSENQRLQAAMAQGNLQTQGAMAGLGGLNSLFGLQASPFQAQMNPLLSYASILGGPTVLSQNRSRSQDTLRSSSSGSGRGFNFDSSWSFFDPER